MRKLNNIIYAPSMSISLNVFCSKYFDMEIVAVELNQWITLNSLYSGVEWKYYNDVKYHRTGVNKCASTRIIGKNKIVGRMLSSIHFCCFYLDIKRNARLSFRLNFRASSKGYTVLGCCAIFYLILFTFVWCLEKYYKYNNRTFPYIFHLKCASVSFSSPLPFSLI